MADREGLFEFDRDIIASQIFPREINPEQRAEIDAALQEIIDLGLIVVYEHESEEFAYIPKFKSNQNINTREAASTLPKPRVHDNAYALQCNADALQCNADELQCNAYGNACSPSLSPSSSHSLSSSPMHADALNDERPPAAEICLEVQRILADNGLKIINPMAALSDVESMIAAGVTLEDVRSVYRCVCDRTINDFHRKRLIGSHWAKHFKENYNDLMEFANAPPPGEPSDDVKRTMELYEKAKAL